MAGEHQTAMTHSPLRRFLAGPQHLRGILAGVTAMSIVTISPVFLAGAFGSQISDDLEIGPAALGGIAAIFFVVTGLSATHLGRLADRLTGQTAGRWAVGASITSLALIGLSQSYLAIIGAMAIGGIGNGLGGPTANMIVADRIPDKSMGIAFGVKQSAVPGATFLGGLAIPLFVTTFGWRPTIIGAAILACFALLSVPQASLSPKGRTGSKRRVRPGLDKITLATGAAFMFGIAVATSMTTLLSTYVNDVGLSASFAGVVLSAGSLGAIAVRIVGGRAADRGTINPARVTTWMMIIGSLGYLLIATGVSAGIASGAFLAYAIGWGWSGLLILNLMRAHPDTPGSATGVVLTFAAIGGMLGPATIGWTAEHVGFTQAWVVVGFISLLAAIAARLSGTYFATSPYGSAAGHSATI